MARTAQKKTKAKTARNKLPRKRFIEKAPPPPKHEETSSFSVTAVLLLLCAVFLFLALYSQLEYFTAQNGLDRKVFSSFKDQSNLMGPLGAVVASILLLSVGYCAFLTVLWCALTARNISAGLPLVKEGESYFRAFSRLALSTLAFLSAGASILSILIGEAGGGIIGRLLSAKLIAVVNTSGALLLSGTLLVFTLGVASGLGSTFFLSLLRSLFQKSKQIIFSPKPLSEKPEFPLENEEEEEFLEAELQPEPSLSQKSVSLVANTSYAEKPFVLGIADFDSRDIDSRPINRAPAPKLLIKREEPQEEAELEEEPEEEFTEDSELEQDEPALKGRSGLKKLKILRTLRAKHRERQQKKQKQERTEPKPKSNDFKLPPSELLVRGESNEETQPQDKELIDNSKRLEQALQNFKIGGKVVEVHPGPVITLYQFEPAPGVKVQRIISLADDLALALKVASVRVYAPVPGKGTVGIEVPNSNREIVRLRDLIETKSFFDNQHQLSLALGKDTFGDVYISDLSKMPHLLIAGATGTGKSVCINSLILSLLYGNTPQDLRLILIDPKMLELSVYEDIPHLKAPVVTQPKRARGVLWWAVEEMERRYSIMKELGVRNLASYNSLISSKELSKGELKIRKGEGKIIELSDKDVVATTAQQPELDRDASQENNSPRSLSSAQRYHAKNYETLPRIVIIVDELADLMLTVGREIEELLTRLAQKARAAGIHLILATQRPSVNVITGLIKANFPSRISFKVASRIDARTVLDTSGAEKLLGQGDMLFLSAGAGRPKRLHSPFVSDQEVHEVVEFIRDQGEPDYDPQIEAMIEKMEASENQAQGGGEPGAEGDYDALYDQAVNVVLEKGSASTSMIQRVFRIGYNRAARILEVMERDGIVGPADGAKPRPVLVPHGDLKMVR